MQKKQIVQDMLWKYSHTAVEQQGTLPIDFETHLICYRLLEFNEQGEQQSDSSYVVDIFAPDVSLGVQEALKTMKVGEQSLFEINQLYKYSQQQVLYYAEQQENLVQICNNQFWLIKIENTFPQDLSLCCNFLSLKETISQIRLYGSQLFTQMHYNQCLLLYKVITTINLENFASKQEKSEIKYEISKSFSNQAICYSKLKDWLLMLEMCVQAISYDALNEKGLYFQICLAQFLLGKANFELGQKSEAQEQFKLYQLKFPTANFSEVNAYLKKCEFDFEKITGNDLVELYSNRKNDNYYYDD